MANTLADGISRWDVVPFPPNSPHSADVNWQEQILGKAGIGLITDVVASCTSAEQLRTRLGERTNRVADLGTRFAG